MRDSHCSRAGDATIQAVEHLDVVIVGAGLSGIGAAHHLQDRLPGLSYAILEGREAIGGTWDLFRYPGVRSDSDMQTLGYRFKPWTDEKALADGPSILEYVRETASEAGIDQYVRFGHQVRGAAWADGRWTLDIDGREPLSCSFLYVCGGYYRYDQAYLPSFDDAETFTGEIIHPQFWPEDFDYTGKRVVVIGSGATAVTIVPAMTDKAAHVTMLQRSPTYILSLPSKDKLGNALRRWLGNRRGYQVTRWKNVAVSTLVYQLSQRLPKLMRRLIRKGVLAQVPAGYPVDTHFNPTYGPWDQRLCLVPDGDLFRAISRDKASIVTDRVERFTPHGVQLASGDAPRRRRDHHRHRPEPAGLRRPRAHRRRRARPPPGPPRLQGHDALRRPELRVHDRLHQRVLDAQGRPRRRVHLPHPGPHGPARLHDRRPARCSRASSAHRCSTSRPATSNARCTCSRRPAPRPRGGSA